MNNIKPRANAQMEGTVLPLFWILNTTEGPHKQVYFHGHDTGIIIKPHDVDRVQATCFNTRATLARIVAESRRK